MEKGAATMKRLFLELGGKSATIVLEDADFGMACAIGIAPLHARGAGLRQPDPDAAAAIQLRGGRRDPEGIYENITCRRPAGPRHVVWSGDFGQAAVNGCRLHPEGRR